MKYRSLGKSGIEASAVGLGAWAIGGWMWGGTEESEAISAIHAGLDVGINLVDTAPIYGFGRSEEVVGKAICDRRDKVVLATKCGLVWHKEGGVRYFDSDDLHPNHGEAKYHVHKWLKPEIIRYELELSLKRLQTDYIDLYQTHWQEDTTPIADVMSELLKMKDEGKIRAIGVSNATQAEIHEYIALGVIDSDQERFSLLDATHEKSGRLSHCAEGDIAFLAYSPIEQGLLTGKVGPNRTFADGDQRSNSPRFSVENREKVSAMLAEFQPIAESHGISLAQLAIAWTIQQRGCTHALVGARSAKQAIENAAAGAAELSSYDISSMTDSIAKHYPELR